MNNGFELSDEQLAAVTGASGSLINIENVGNPKVAVNNAVQINLAVAPTIGVAVGSDLAVKGAGLNLANLGLLKNQQ